VDAATAAADAAAVAGCANSPRFLLLAGHFPARRKSCGVSGPRHTRISFIAQSGEGQQLTTVAGSFCCPTKDKPDRYGYQPDRTTSNWMCTARDVHDGSDRYAVRNTDRSGR
jgi:hypothetical protein